MKTSLDPGRPLRGLWKNGNRYFHFTADKLTIADFSEAVPTIRFTKPGDMAIPQEGWEKITTEQFNEMIDGL